MAHITFTDWTVPVAQVGSRPGQTMELKKTFPAPEGIGDEVVGVTAGAPVDVDGRFDSIVDGLIFTGTISAPVHEECSRCAKASEEQWDEQVTAFFPYEPTESVDNDGNVEIIAGEEEAEDVYPLLDDGAWADIEPMIRDTFFDVLPLQPLCRPDCKGLCPQCGLDLNEQPAHEHRREDIRFASLAALKQQLERE